MDREITVKVTRDTVGKTSHIHLIEKVNGHLHQTMNVEGENIEKAIVQLYELSRPNSFQYSIVCPIIKPLENSPYPWLCNEDLCRGWDKESDSCILIQKPEKKRSLKQWLKNLKGEE